MKSKHYPPVQIAGSPLTRPGYAAGPSGLTATQLGDKVEAAIAGLKGWKALVGATAGRTRQGAFDVQAPDGTWCEVKAVTVWAREYKVKPSAKDILEKLAWAAEHGRAAATVIAVVDADGTAWIYRRAGLGCFRLAANGMGWTYDGKVKI